MAKKMPMQLLHLHPVVFVHGEPPESAETTKGTTIMAGKGKMGGMHGGGMMPPKMGKMGGGGMMGMPKGKMMMGGGPTKPTRKTPGNIDFKTKLKHPKPSGLY